MESCLSENIECLASVELDGLPQNQKQTQQAGLSRTWHKSAGTVANTQWRQHLSQDAGGGAIETPPEYIRIRAVPAGPCSFDETFSPVPRTQKNKPFFRSLTEICSSRDSVSSNHILSGCIPLDAASALRFTSMSSANSREEPCSKRTLPATLCESG